MVNPVAPAGDRATGEDMSTTGGGSDAVVAPEKTVDPPVATANNRIVIQTFHRKDDLIPVQQYYAGHGIVTEIRVISGRFYLVTENKYENPANPGTDGNKARQTIRTLGADYKAPEGFESFAPNLFGDAFGMKFDD